MICGMTDAPYEVVHGITVEVDWDAGDVPIEDAGEAALVPSLVGRRIVEDCVICVVILRGRQEGIVSALNFHESKRKASTTTDKDVPAHSPESYQSSTPSTR